MFILNSVLVASSGAVVLSHAYFILTVECGRCSVTLNLISFQQCREGGVTKRKGIVT